MEVQAHGNIYEDIKIRELTGLSKKEYDKLKKNGYTSAMDIVRGLHSDVDIITKRQLNKALQEQVKGDKRTLGEILVDKGFCEFDDITDALLNHDSDTKKHEDKQKEIQPEPTPVSVVEPTPQSVVEPEPDPVKEEPIEISEDKVMGTKFTMSIQTIVALVLQVQPSVTPSLNQ